MSGRVPSQSCKMQFRWILHSAAAHFTMTRGKDSRWNAPVAPLNARAATSFGLVSIVAHIGWGERVVRHFSREARSFQSERAHRGLRMSGLCALHNAMPDFSEGRAWKINLLERWSLGKRG